MSAWKGCGTNVLCALLVLALWAAVARCDVRCLAQSGTCTYTSEGCSGGSFTRGLCQGPNNRQCCVPDYTAADSRCRSRGGTCQRLKMPCAGAYQVGLCGGPADRRCCLPPETGATGPGSSGSCPAEVQKLACQLAKSDNVVAANHHASRESDHAYAINNLRDVCAGRQASRSRYTCDECPSGAPGGFTCLSAIMLGYLVDLQNGGKVKINEIAGACHSCQSYHYAGLAVDLNRLEPGTSRDRTGEYLEKCEQHGGWKKDEKTHIHCQFRK